jgi:spermidine synthase
VLVLDGVIQATERDEFAYQEMITHVPLNAHPNPKKVLVVGGGDGGVLREITKHDCVEKIDIVEIDESVVRLAKVYLPDMAKGFNDPRVTLHITDGFEFLAQRTNEYDVIISDTSDPEGPAIQLFQEAYFRLLDNALTEKGVIAMQASENVWLKIGVLQQLKATCRRVFPRVEYTATCVPTYTSGQLGLMICSKDPQNDIRKPTRAWNEKKESTINRYYNQAIHTSSFVVPTFARKYVS